MELEPHAPAGGTPHIFVTIVSARGQARAINMSSPMQSERSFRTNRVAPFLESLDHCVPMSIQQVAIVADADIICCIRGLFVWLEIKKEGEGGTRLQQYKADKIRKKGGGIAIEVKPENWNLVKEFLNQLDGGILDTDSLQRLGGRGISTQLAKTKTEPNAHPGGVQHKAHRKVPR